MQIREKCLIHTELNSDQIATLEKMVDHSGMLYANIAFTVFGKNGQEVMLADNRSLREKASAPAHGAAGRRKKEVPVYLGINNKAGMAIIEEEEGQPKNPFSDFIGFCTKLPYSYYPANYLVPDGLILIDFNGAIQAANFVAESILHRLGLQGLPFNEIVAAFGFSQLDLINYLKQPVFLGFNLQHGQFEISVVLNPLFTGEKFIGALVVISDVSPVKRKEKELLEKHTVIKEIHHRVKNNLQTITSLLRLQMRRTNLKTVEKVLNESINRILSIALIHEALSKQNFEVISIKQTSYNILQMILSNMVDPSQNIKGEVFGDEVHLPATIASSVSLCITELIQNAVEHAFVNRSEGNIRVIVEQKQDEVFITVEDNGIGISAGKIQKEGSLGMQIVNNIIRRNLKGDFSLESYRYGTVARIRFPVVSREGVEL